MLSLLTGAQHDKAGQIPFICLMKTHFFSLVAAVALTACASTAQTPVLKIPPPVHDGGNAAAAHPRRLRSHYR